MASFLEEQKQLEETHSVASLEHCWGDVFAVVAICYVER
jgi:hypothetical protein